MAKRTSLPPPAPDLPDFSPPGRRRPRPQPRRATLQAAPRPWTVGRVLRPLVALAALAGLAGGAYWLTHRPEPGVVEAPALTPALRRAIVEALHPGWPGSAPTFGEGAQAMRAVEGRVEAIAAADVDGDGTPEWAVAYSWLGAPDATGARPARPGFAVLAAGERPVRVYAGPATGGWNGPKDAFFDAASEVTASVEAVALSPREVGFLYRYGAELSRGGRLSHARYRLFAPDAGGWGMPWEGEAESRWRAGTSEETSRTHDARVEDLDADGEAEVLVAPGYYQRRLEGAAGTHFSALGDWQLVYRRRGDRYVLDAVQAGATSRRVRAGAPLLAVRARGPVQVDGQPAEWEAAETSLLSGLRLEDPGLIKYRRRDRRGLEDCSGEVRLMWDAENLYAFATVLDDSVYPGPAGRMLYQGDHLALWIDRDLEGDFARAGRDADDWQLGFSPGNERAPEPHGYAWVPRPGDDGLRVASWPHRDPYSGSIWGYQLEIAIPWSRIGGLPPGLTPAAEPGAVAPVGPGAPRHYDLRLAGVVGFAALLTDADTRPQELVYVSEPGFAWADPTTFNTLLLVE